jgi:hypothetical protein
MGFRTVVVVSNDRLDDVADPVLKDAILGWWSAGACGANRYMVGPYRVVEQVHCDHASLLAVNHLDAKLLGSSYWDNPNLELALLKDAAESLGYRLVKKKR